MKNRFKIVLFLVINSLFYIYSDVTTDLSVRKIEEILQYGIESEVVTTLKEIGSDPKEDILSKVFSRYKDSLLLDTKIAFIDYFSNTKTLPSYILDSIYNDASSDIIERRLKSSLINCLGKKGGIREGNFLLAMLDNYDNIIKNIAADAISKMKVKELAKPLLDRMILSDDNSEKFLSNDIKTKLVNYFGENKSEEAIPYLKKIVSSKETEKFLKMFSMVALLKIGDASSIDIIAENLKDGDIKIQEYAAYALSLFKNRDALLYLRKMLLHNNENVRIYAIQGIYLNEDYESLTPIVYKFRNDPSKKVQDEALMTLLYFGEKGIDCLKDFFKGKKYNSSQIFTISKAVAQKPNQAGVDYLLKIYLELDKKDREVVARNIVNSSSNLVDPIIKELLRSSDYLIRIGAIKSVYTIEKSTLWEDVENIAKNDPVETVKINARRFLDMRKTN
ncbi:MAG TPA: hypothetical protein PK771_00915 [Spirochaetota bacterium]|nr:hypothetical protein [Spirochaetota bacterium]